LIRERSLDLAFAIALIWVVHPLNSEAVDYITQRTESMMALFYLLTLYCAVRAATAQSWRPPLGGPRGPAEAGHHVRFELAWTSAAIACCALGMASKES